MTNEEAMRIVEEMIVGKANRQRRLKNSFDRLDLVLGMLSSTDDPATILVTIRDAVAAEREVLFE